VIYAKGGNYAKVKIPGVYNGPRAKRGEVRGFSGRSQRALLAQVNSIDRERCHAGHFAFVTPTYPRAFPTARASKRHLDDLMKRFERAYGVRWIIWKLEPQQRGAPHYHLLIYMGGAFDVGELCAWFAHAWHEIAGGGDPNHLKWHLGHLSNRPCVEQVRDWQGVGNYAAKYLGKLSIGDEEWQHPGRFWGQRRADLAPITMVTQDATRAVAVKVRRVLVNRYESLPSGWYYLPGRLMPHGKHRAGERIHRKQLRRFVMGGQEAPLHEMLASISETFQTPIRPQHRRWKGRSGGWSGFIAAAAFERLVTWATTETVAHAMAARKGRRSGHLGPGPQPGGGSPTDSGRRHSLTPLHRPQVTAEADRTR
jgi:hypothetical protein